MSPRPQWLVILRAFGRLSAIATTLFANGFGWFVRAMRLDVCVSLRCRTVCALTTHQCDHHLAVADSSPERLRALLEHLGPTFVKLGQLASLRPDLVPLPYAEALRVLQDQAEPIPLEAIERVISGETGSTAEDLFAEFDPVPVASASLSQVHRARLHDGSDVAVKVQRPGAARLVARDLELIELMADRLERYSPQVRRYRPRASAAEFAAYTRRELDFVREARTMEQVRANMRPLPRIVIPAVHWELTGPRTLVMDFVDGVRVDDPEGIATLGIDVRRVAETAAAAALRQVFVDGLFHADPHPGNVVLLREDRVALLDFGMYGRVDPWLRRRLGLAFASLIDGEGERAAEQLIRSASVGGESEVEEYRSALARVVSEWQEDREAISVAQLMLRMLGLGVEFGVTYPREMMLVARSLVAAEGSVKAADPSLDIAELAAASMGGIRSQLARTTASLGRGLIGSRSDALELFEELPVVLPRIIDLLERQPAMEQPAAGDGVVRNAGGAAPLLALGVLIGWGAGRWAQRRGRG